MALEGKVALVTGGRGGIGRAICERFVKEGAIVYAADLDGGGSLGDMPADNGERFIELDVTDEASVKAAFARIEREEKRLNILVNAAGIEIEETIEHTSLEQWNRLFAVNVTGTFLCGKHALKLLRAGAASGRGAP